MKAILTGVKYNIDNDGNTQSIDASFSGYDDGESVNATARLTDGDLDSLSRKQIEAAGRTKAATFFDVTADDTKPASTETAAPEASTDTTATDTGDTQPTK